MLYKVRLQYAIHVDARDKSSAYQQAVEILRKDPRTAIGSIEQADAPKQGTPLIKRLITGQ